MVKTLVTKYYPKRKFNPESVEDLKVYKYFIENQSWGSAPCPFEVEWPFISIPDMLAFKIAEHRVSTVK